MRRASLRVPVRAAGGTIRAEPSTTRDTIRTAAIEVFYLRGYAAATIRQIAARLGMRGGSIYNHYTSKQEILRDIMSRTIEQLSVGLDEATAGESEPGERIRQAVIYHVRFHKDHRKEAFLADSELRSLEPEAYREIVRGRKRYEKAVQAILEDGVRAATFTLGDTRLASYAIITACSAVGTWFRPEGPQTIDEVAEAYADFMIRAIESRPHRHT